MDNSEKRPPIPDYSDLPDKYWEAIEERLKPAIPVITANWVYLFVTNKQANSATFNFADHSKELITNPVYKEYAEAIKEWLELPYFVEQRRIKAIDDLRNMPYSGESISYEQWLYGMAMQGLASNYEFFLKRYENNSVNAAYQMIGVAKQLVEQTLKIQIQETD